MRAIHPNTTIINYPFGMLMDGRSFTSAVYCYSFNGKEKDIEGIGGGGSTYDYGFRIYNPQIAKFLSVDPLFKSYPFYTPYQFAGNKPIQAIDLDGLEEKIVLYSFYSDGGVKIETWDYNKLLYSIQVNGKYATHKTISKTEFEKLKKEYFEGNRLAPKMFTSGFKKYTDGQAPDNSTVGYIGPQYGTLTVVVPATSSYTISYDPTPVQEKQESMAEIIIRNTFTNPDYRQKKFNSTVSNYVAGVSAPITAGLVLQYGGIASTVGGSASLVNTADDLAGELTGQTPIKLTLGEQNGAVFKTGLSTLSLGGAYSGLKDAPLRTATTLASDILGGAINLNQCLNESKTTN